MTEGERLYLLDRGIPIEPFLLREEAEKIDTAADPRVAIFQMRALTYIACALFGSRWVGFDESDRTETRCPKCGGVAMPEYHKENLSITAPGVTCGYVSGRGDKYCDYPTPVREHLSYRCACGWNIATPTKDAQWPVLISSS